jgi:proteasome lid subunit RPN8/RPN11
MPGVSEIPGSPPAALSLTANQRNQIIEHCIAGYPDEACGLLTGPLNGLHPTGVVTAVHPAANAARSARVYTVASSDLLGAMRAAEAVGDDLIAVYHSHTHTDPYPSTTDIAQAHEPTWIYVLVGLATPQPTLRAYRIADGRVHEIPVEVA